MARNLTENEQRRLANMRTVLASGQYENATELARALGITKGSLSQLIGANPMRAISERTARTWERTLGLPNNSLDTPPVRPSAPPDAPRVPVPVVQHAPAEAQTQVLDDVMRAVEATGIRLPPDRYRTVITLLYRLAVRMGGVVDAADVHEIVHLARG